MVEVAGKIVEQSVSNLIDPGSTHSYISGSDMGSKDEGIDFIR